MRTKTYRLSFNSPVFYPIIFALFAAIVLWTESSSYGRLLLFVMVLVFAGLAWLAVRSSLVVVDSNGLRATRLFSSVELRWDEIIVLAPRFGGGFSLHNHDHSKTLRVSSQLKDFEDLVWQIWREAPNALQTQEREFHVSFWAHAAIILVSISMVLFGFGPLIQGDIGYKPFLLLVGIMMLLIQLNLPRRVTLLQDRLQLNSWVSQIVYSKAETKSVELRSRHERWGTKLIVAILLRSGKQILISDIREGIPLFFAALDTWYRS